MESFIEDLNNNKLKYIEFVLQSLQNLGLDKLNITATKLTRAGNG